MCYTPCTLTNIVFFLLFRLLAVICSRKKPIHGKKWNEYEPNTMALQPVAIMEGGANPISSASKEELTKKTEEL